MRPGLFSRTFSCTLSVCARAQPSAQATPSPGRPLLPGVPPPPTGEAGRGEKHPGDRRGQSPAPPRLQVGARVGADGGAGGRVSFPWPPPGPTASVHRAVPGPATLPWSAAESPPSQSTRGGPRCQSSQPPLPHHGDGHDLEDLGLVVLGVQSDPGGPEAALEADEHHFL